MNPTIETLLIASIIVAVGSIFFGLSKRTNGGCYSIIANILMFIINLMAIFWTKDLLGIISLIILFIALIIIGTVGLNRFNTKLEQVMDDPYDYL